MEYLTNKDLFSLDSLPESMLIFGAGPIAVEMAQAFNRLGTKVTVVQRSGQILSREDRDMADRVMRVISDEGVTFLLNVTVSGVRDLGRNKEVIVQDKAGNDHSLEAEKLLVALGRSPNVQDLGLEEIDIELSRRGIVVDSQLRTRHRHIYAAGDVNGVFQFTHAAGYEGSIVVSNAIFHLPRKVNYSLRPWCTYSDPELASIGMNEKAALKAGIPYTVWSEDMRDNDRFLAEGGRTGRIKMILDDKDHPIGVQILGPHGGELLSEWVAALNGKLKLSVLAGAVHPYPALSEINKRVVGSYFSPRIFSSMVKKGLKFFFQLKGPACDPSSDFPK